MTRANAITYAQVAGYHNDTRSFMRLLIEARVQRQAMHDAWRMGVQAKKQGAKCSCAECNGARS